MSKGYYPESHPYEGGSFVMYATLSEITKIPKF